jgi:hypothetical protein
LTYDTVHQAGRRSRRQAAETGDNAVRNGAQTPTSWMRRPLGGYCVLLGTGLKCAINSL